MMDVTRKDLGGGIAVLKLDVKLNMTTASCLRDHVGTAIAQGQTRLTIDMNKVDFMDSSGLGALINGLKTTRLAGGDLKITGTSEQVRLVLRLTNLESLLATVDEAGTAYPRG